MKKDTHIYDICKKHMHAYVLAEMTDGSKIDGIITGLDDDYVYFAVPKGCAENDQRQFYGGGYQSGYHGGGFGGGYGGYGPGYGYGYGPGFGGYPGQRFERIVLPLAAIAAISLLPWY
ncbi:MAG TPA: hypothetical protein VK061_02260 [Bacillota bacterium]|nr:hypothetical protein [Bacillota bacterium]